MTNVHIHFPQGGFAELRQHLLQDPSSEAFALLLGQTRQAGEQTVIKVIGMHFPQASDYTSRGLAHLRIKREYIYARLVEMQSRGEADTLIDVHTHPFCAAQASFSAVDDRDEIDFHHWLTDMLDDVHYGSIVLSRSDYAARLWQRQGKTSIALPARIKTQTVPENWPASGDSTASESPGAEAMTSDPVTAATDPEQGFLARSVLALGLDNLRRIMHDQCIAVIGTGGLGSVVAENLIHSGFQQLQLIDPDRVEVTNLNRIVGADRAAAEAQRLKVEVVREHLLGINPAATIEAYPLDIQDQSLRAPLARADWLLVTTDNHLSRYHAQATALQFGIPLVSVGSNISVVDGTITDMSGEVIVARYGDRLCLNCLGRLASTQMAAEAMPALGAELARRGYVSGRDVKEPAVKTLNAILGALTVDVLLNQYTERQVHTPILVYENNRLPCIYPDHDSLAQRPKECLHCGDWTPPAAAPAWATDMTAVPGAAAQPVATMSDTTLNAGLT